MSKTLGQELDDYLTKDPNKEIESVYLYMDNNHNPHAVVITSEQDWDYTNIVATDNDLNAEIGLKREEVSKLQAKIKSLERDKKAVESAIKKLVNHRADL